MFDCDYTAKLQLGLSLATDNFFPQEKGENRIQILSDLIVGR